MDNLNYKKSNIQCFYPIVNNEKTFICYYPNLLNKTDLSLLYEWLNSKKFKEGKCISGKEIPRLQLWYQENEKYFCEQWKHRYDRWESLKYDELLFSIQKKVNAKVNEIIDIYSPEIYKPKINSCLINKYRNGNDSIKPHRDTHDSFGEYPTIAGLSLGETRCISFRKIDFDIQNYNSLKEDKESNVDFDIELENNSLFIMAGASQKYFSHQIPKNKSLNTRYSFTFREFKY